MKRIGVRALFEKRQAALLKSKIRQLDVTLRRHRKGRLTELQELSKTRAFADILLRCKAYFPQWVVVYHKGELTNFALMYGIGVGEKTGLFFSEDSVCWQNGFSGFFKGVPLVGSSIGYPGGSAADTIFQSIEHLILKKEKTQRIVAPSNFFVFKYFIKLPSKRKDSARRTFEETMIIPADSLGTAFDELRKQLFSYCGQRVVEWFRDFRVHYNGQWRRVVTDPPAIVGGKLPRGELLHVIFREVVYPPPSLSVSA